MQFYMVMFSVDSISQIKVGLFDLYISL